MYNIRPISFFDKMEKYGQLELRHLMQQDVKGY